MDYDCLDCRQFPGCTCGGEDLTLCLEFDKDDRLGVGETRKDMRKRKYEEI